MSQEPVAREPDVIREEIKDLQAYLDGIPSKLRESGAFVAYEHRMADLNKELILSQLLSQYQSQKTLSESRLRATSEYEQAYQTVEESFRQLEVVTRERFESTGNTQLLTVLANMISIMVSSSFFVLFEKVKKGEGLADYYSALSNIISRIPALSEQTTDQLLTSEGMKELIDRIKS